MTTLAEMVAGFTPQIPIEHAWTPPSSWYTAPAIHQLERQTVFKRSWQPVARTDQLREPGSYVAGCLVGEPYVVVRGHDDELRAFYNTCRHKGREVVTGSGQSEQLVCGYHAWRYDLDGRLRSAPQMAGIQDFDREDMSLVSLPVRTWGPWVFIHRHRDAPELREQITQLERELQLDDFQLKLAGRRSWTIGCNWKVYVDNYLDGGYHIPHMHPTLDAQLQMAEYRTETFERFSIQTCPPAATSDERIDYAAQTRIGERAVYAWIYPNLMLNRYGPCLDSNHVVPLGPDRCRVDYEFYFAETESDEAQRFIEQSIAQSDITQREDIAICESVQLGLGSESYERGRYAPKLEIGEHHFHRLLAADYQRGLADGTGC